MKYDKGKTTIDMKKILKIIADKTEDSLYKAGASRDTNPK